jgi:hypothetical protein
MDIEGVLAIVLIFGGGTLAALSFSPIGRAIADRIRSRVPGGRPGTDPAVLEELERLRQELVELQERVDFAERLLSRSRERDALPEA